MNLTITPSAEVLSLIAGSALSLLFSYTPKLSGWYYKLDDTTKRLVMLVALIAVTAGSFGLACSGWLRGVTCDQNGAETMIVSFILAAMANQGTNGLSPRTGARMKSL